MPREPRKTIPITIRSVHHRYEFAAGPELEAIVCHSSGSVQQRQTFLIGASIMSTCVGSFFCHCLLCDCPIFGDFLAEGV